MVSQAVILPIAWNLPALAQEESAVDGDGSQNSFRATPNRGVIGGSNGQAAAAPAPLAFTAQIARSDDQESSTGATSENAAALLGPATRPDDTAPEQNRFLSRQAFESAIEVSPADSLIRSSYSTPKAEAHSLPKEPATESAEAQPAAAPAPVRDIAVRLPSDTQHLEVRLTERGGDVRVEVRSTDPQLTEEMRGNLHELMNNLERRGLSGEAWHPGSESEVHVSRAGDAQLSQHSSDSQQESGRHQNPQQHQQPQQRESSQSRQARASQFGSNQWTHALNQIFLPK